MSELDKPNFAEDPFQKQGESDIDSLLHSLLSLYKKIKLLFFRYIYYIVIIVLIGIGITVKRVFNITNTYVATIVFMLQEEDSESLSSTATSADPLSAFLLTRVTSKSINIDKLNEISRSQKVFVNVLFSKCIIRGKEDFLINHYLNIYNGQTESYFKNFRGLNGLNRNQYRVFFSVMRNINLNSISIEEQKSGAFKLQIKTIDEELSKVMCEIYYQNISNFYIDKTTEKAQRNYIFLRNRLDSIKNLLYATEYQVANFEDRAQNLLLLTARVPQARQVRNTEYYKLIFLETLKSFESSKVALNNITPIFQVLNRPYYPLYSERESRMFITLVGIMITGFIVILFISVLYFINYIWPPYKNLIKEDLREDLQ